MSQHDYSIANNTFPLLRSDVNDVLAAIQSSNSGSSAPTSLAKGLSWLDTSSSPNIFKIYDGSSWIEVFTIDPSTHELGGVALDDLSNIADGTIVEDMIASEVTNRLITDQAYIKMPEIANNSTDSDHDIDIGVGSCRAKDNSVNIDVTTSITKRIDATWVVGTGNGGLATGTVAANTTYHVFVIKNTTTGVVDVGFDTSLTATNLLSTSGYHKYRRIASVVTDSSANILPFKQDSNYLFHKKGILDLNDTTTSDVTDGLISLTVPTGIKVRPILRTNALWTASSGFAYLYSTSGAYGSGNYYSFFEASSIPIANVVQRGHCDTIFTNTSGQIKYAHTGAANTYFRVYTIGWVDDRLD